MKLQSIYFLQALWDADIQRNLLLQLAKKAMLNEVHQVFNGVMNADTLWLSDKSQKIKQKMNSFESDIEKMETVYDLITLNENIEEISNQVSSLQIKTIQTLNSEAGIDIEDMHILVRQLRPYALAKTNDQIAYQLYRICVLSGRFPDYEYYLLDTKDIYLSFQYFKEIVMPFVEQMDINTIDSRWAYEMKRIRIDGGMEVQQFVSVEPRNEELKQPLGIPNVGVGDKGEFRIYGRGRITNLNLRDFKDKRKLKVYEDMPYIDDYSDIPKVNNNPACILDVVFDKKKYLLTPEKYFDFANRYILSKDFYYRIHEGRCLYCGELLMSNICSRCNQRW